MIKRYLIAVTASMVMYAAVFYGTTTEWKTAIGMALAAVASLTLIGWSVPDEHQ